MEKKKRLIDADKLETRICDLCDEFDTDHLFIDAIIYEIGTARAVDAVEVVHGEWVVCGDGEYVPFMCSACSKTTAWYHAQTANYCPNCGAKMDGDKNE